MFFAALGMLVVPFMFLWAVFRVITGSAFWRRAFKYFFVMFGVVVVAGILLSGCSTAAPSVAQPTSQVIFVTPEPTAKATARPTVSAAARWNAYTDHVQGSVPALVAAFSAESDAASAGDFDGARSGALSIVTLVDAELAWLDANPPEPCYAEEHRLYRSALVLDRGGSQMVADGIDALDADLISAGGDMISAGGDAMDLATAELPRVAC